MLPTARLTMVAPQVGLNGDSACSIRAYMSMCGLLRILRPARLRPHTLPKVSVFLLTPCIAVG